MVPWTRADMATDWVHPDTGRPITGAPTHDWKGLSVLVTNATRRSPAAGTLEVNFGGDLIQSLPASACSTTLSRVTFCATAPPGRGWHADSETELREKGEDRR